jgi:SAM-dependent methyltransferase
MSYPWLTGAAQGVSFRMYGHRRLRSPSTVDAMPPSASDASKFETAQFTEAQRIAHARLYPSIFASNYLVLSNRRERMRSFFESRDNVGKVLDVGAQYCPYYPLFSFKCESYTSLDMVRTDIVDIVCDAEDMPIEDGQYDLVLCTQVLEHCTHPDRIVNECYRVLKKGGTFIVTVPSIYPVHGYPADNWRFMPDGLRHLLRAFSEVEILGELDFAESFASVLCHYSHVITGRLGRIGKIANPMLAFATNIGARGLSFAVRPITNSNFTAFTMNLWAECKK